jgi:DNA-binding PadR family transcriptional regulator
MSTAKDLTPTSYALLGLLAIRPWTSYELAAQMDRTLSRFWPRARSKLYEEPKKLVAKGLAEATKEAVGRRPRTVYGITPEGRLALAAWLARPGEGPVVEFEQLLKVFFADSGSTADLLHTLQDVRAWAQERTLVDIEVGRSYLEGRGAFPERAAILVLTGRILDDLVGTVDRWAQWATEIAETWPDRPGDAEPDLAALEVTVLQALERSAQWRAAAGRHRRDEAGEGT